MKAIWAAGLMILIALTGSALADDGPGAKNRFFTDSSGQRLDRGYINHRAEYEEIAPRRPDTPDEWIIERNGNVVRTGTGGAPGFNRDGYGP